MKFVAALVQKGYVEGLDLEKCLGDMHASARDADIALGKTLQASLHELIDSLPEVLKSASSK